MSAVPDIYVLDTSAWFTLIEDEAGAERVQELLEQARASTVVVLVSFMSFMEGVRLFCYDASNLSVRLPLGPLSCHQSLPPEISCKVGRAEGISENFAR